MPTLDIASAEVDGFNKLDDADEFDAFSQLDELDELDAFTELDELNETAAFAGAIPLLLINSQSIKYVRKTLVASSPENATPARNPFRVDFSLCERV